MVRAQGGEIVYVYMCVCVCVCVQISEGAEERKRGTYSVSPFAVPPVPEALRQIASH